MYNVLNCSTNFGNTGLQNCAEDFGAIEKIIFVPKGVEIATSTEAALLDTWVGLTNAAKSTRMYPTPRFFNMTDSSEEPTRETGYLNKSDFVINGRYVFSFPLEKIPMYLAQQLKKFNGAQMNVYLLTSNGYVLGTSSDGIKFEPFNTDEIRFLNTKFSTGEILQRETLTLTLSDADEYNVRGVYVKPTGYNPVLAINGIKDLKIDILTSAAASVDFKISGRVDNVSVTGATDENFVFYNSTNVAQAFTVAENADGSYTATFTTPLSAGTYTASLMPQPVGVGGLKGYEVAPDGEAKFTIS